MREPGRAVDVHRSMRRLNPVVIILAVMVLLLLLLVAYFASGSRIPNQDKLTDKQVSEKRQAAAPEKRCASQATYDLVKRELFRRAAQMRGSNQSAYDRLANYAVVRVENPVLENADGGNGAANCSGTLSLDLPPDVAVVGGRRTLTSDIDYTVQSAADGTGNVVLLRNADSIVVPLATLARLSRPAEPAAPNVVVPEASPAQPESPPSQPPAPQPATPPRPVATRPSFDCAKARTRGEDTVCANAGLAALDRNMAAQYAGAFAAASPDQRDLLRTTAHRFYAYRDRCPDARCVGDAYVGRMREIRDIMEGRWQSPR